MSKDNSSPFHLSLFDLNTLLPHRAGIAGLALALSVLNPDDAPLKWEVTQDSVKLIWQGSDREAVQWLLQQTYQIESGLLIAPALNLDRQGRFTLNQGILSTFLQHGKQKGFVEDPTKPRQGKKKFYRTQTLTFTIEPGQPEILERYTLLEWCYYLDGTKIGKAFSKDKFIPAIEVKGHHLPGLVECFVNGSYKESPEHFLALLFLPLACGYYQLPDYRSVVIIPEVVNLKKWVQQRQELSGRTYRSFRSSSAGESVLRFLLEEKLIEDSQNLRVKYCEAYQLGGQPWDNSQSYLKQSVYRVNADDKVLELFQIADQLFPPRVRQKPNGETWLAISKVLPWIAENLVAGRVWYAGFYEFRKANEIYERRGLVAMTQYLQPHEQVLFDAVKGAFSVYLSRQIEQITDKEKRRFTNDEYRRVTDKVIYRFQRPNTQQEFATALVDFLSQFRSKALRAVGPQIYSWIHSSEWRKARDLAMLAIATYQGRSQDGTTDAPDSPPEPEAETESEVYEESLL